MAKSNSETIYRIFELLGFTSCFILTIISCAGMPFKIAKVMRNMKGRQFEGTWDKFKFIVTETF